MHQFNGRKFGILVLLGGVVGVALAADPLSNTLTVHRIVAHDGGSETAESAATAKPGDVLEYVAKFHNNSASTARALSATVPLPVGTEFVADSSQPSGARASTDGISFDTIPLKRVVKQADGGTREELVPRRDYRYLRWPAADLPANGDLSVSVRVVVSTLDSAG